jgi:acetolactate decarboxylase
MRKTIFAAALLILASQAARAQESAADAIYQIATWKSLNAGLYQGFTTCADLLKRGDFGFGVFEALDGECVILDGRAYRILANGEVQPAAATNRLCFAMVKLFEPNQSGIRAETLSLAEMQDLFDNMLQTRNLPLAVKFDGDFVAVTIAAVSRQAPPYPPLSQALQNETTQTLKNVTGTVIGFRMPSYFGEASPAGYRLYFMKRDRALGGRVLDLRARNMRFDFDYSHRLHTELPAWGEFYSMP